MSGVGLDFFEKLSPPLSRFRSFGFVVERDSSGDFGAMPFVNAQWRRVGAPRSENEDTTRSKLSLDLRGSLASFGQVWEGEQVVFAYETRYVKVKAKGNPFWFPQGNSRLASGTGDYTIQK